MATLSRSTKCSLFFFLSGLEKSTSFLSVVVMESYFVLYDDALVYMLVFHLVVKSIRIWCYWMFRGFGIKVFVLNYNYYIRLIHSPCENDIPANVASLN